MFAKAFLASTLIAVLVAPLPRAVPSEAAQPAAPPAVLCEQVAGSLFVRTAEGWDPVKVGTDLPVGAHLLVLFQAKLLSANRAVQAVMVGDIGMHGQLPVMEAALELGEAKGFDLALKLRRGIVVLENRKPSGSAKVQLVLNDQPLEITLSGPGAKIGVEVYGRHAPGRPDFKSDDPTHFVMILAFKGDILLAHKEKTVKLQAPPGPALLRWDSLGKQVDIEHLKELPPALQNNVQMKLTFAKMAQSAQTLAAPDQERRRQALKKLIGSDLKIDRLVGVTAAGALDELGILLAALNDARHADTREQAVLVLRHWAGREPGQLKHMQGFLKKEKGVSEARTGSMLHLLLGFATRDDNTLDLLVNLLDSPHLGVRTLAYWHLVRLAPEGKEFGYDPAASEEHRRPALERWRKLVSAGETTAPQPK